LPETLPDTLRPPSMALVRLSGRLRRRDCGSLVVGPVWVMLMSYCLVTRSPKAYPEVRLLARECLRLRCCSCRRGSYHRLFRCRRNPDCWGRWDRCRARPVPMLESRNWHSRTGRPAPRPACSGRLSVRRCYAIRNRPRAPAHHYQLRRCISHPAAHSTLQRIQATLLRQMVLSGQRKGAVNVCRMPSCRETPGTE
jgi:hypothetical protein